MARKRAVNPLDEKMNKMTDRELYKMAKGRRDALLKRYKRLKENVDRDPVKYSPHGLKVYEDEGIPMVSTKMSRTELRNTIKRLENIWGMKTGTSRGASKHQRELIKRMAGVPIDKRLNAAEQRRYEDFRNYIGNNEETLKNFWKAFDHYKDEMAYSMIDSDRLLNEFRKVYDNMVKDGARTPKQFFDRIDEIVDNLYEDEESNELLDTLGEEDGFL